jgi:hypothetical protein
VKGEAAPAPHAIHWRRLDHPAEEDAVVERAAEGGWLLHGAVTGTLEDGRDYALRYEVACAPDWVTRSATVAGHVGGEPAHVALTRDGATGRWTRDGTPVASLDGCLDVDLGFSPSTNMLPIRRLGLPVGGEAAVRAAGVRFPELVIEPLEQRYENLGDGRYAYESGAGRFRATLDVDALGVVRRYGEYWVADGPERAGETRPGGGA